MQPGIRPFLSYIMSDLLRNSGGLDQIHYWKAIELRQQFSIYAGPIVLKYILNKNKYLLIITL